MRTQFKKKKELVKNIIIKFISNKYIRAFISIKKIIIEVLFHSLAYLQYLQFFVLCAHRFKLGCLKRTKNVLKLKCTFAMYKKFYYMFVTQHQIYNSVDDLFPYTFLYRMGWLAKILKKICGFKIVSITN